MLGRHLGATQTVSVLGVVTGIVGDLGEPREGLRAPCLGSSGSTNESMKHAPRFAAWPFNLVSEIEPTSLLSERNP